MARPLLLLVAALAAAPAAIAHHTYAMFDATRATTLRGTVARLEWRNPHVYLWVYVPRTEGGGYDLYAFENGAVPVLERLGWSRDGFPVGAPVTVEFAPLKDGRHGGHIIRLTRGDGTTLIGSGVGHVRTPAGTVP